MANAGFDTAEAATETYFHAVWSGDIHQLTDALSAQVLAKLDALNDPKGQEEFERKFREGKDSAGFEASGIQGTQLLAQTGSASAKGLRAQPRPLSPSRTEEMTTVFADTN